METEKEKLMRLLNISDQEAEEVMAYDKAVEHNEATDYDLTKDQQKVVKEMTRAKSPTVYKFTQRERKPNVTKGELIQFLANALKGYECQNLEITNKERMIAFSLGENDFELTLTQKRKKKG